MKYEVDRKVPGETIFKKIAEKDATGISFSTQNYQLADTLISVQAGPIMYRIRQIIDTADTTAAGADYIDTVSVNLAATCTTTPVTNVPVINEEYIVLPNPTQSKISLRITTPTAITALTFRLIDSRGRVVAVQKGGKGPGTATFNFAVSHLAKGIYYITVYKEDVRVVTKEFMKL